MQCVEFEDRLNRLLDHRMSPDEDGPLADHARECEACAGLFHAQQRLFAGLRSDSPATPVGLAERVVSQRHSEISHRKSAWRNATWGVLLASAASLGGLAMMTLKARDDQQNGGQPNVAVTTPGKAVPSPGLGIGAVGVTKNVDPKGEEKFDEYFVVLENIAIQISDSKEFDEMSESLEPSIKPIRSSFGLAIDALRRTLPRGREAKPAKPDAGAHWTPDLPVIS